MFLNLEPYPLQTYFFYHTSLSKELKFSSIHDTIFFSLCSIKDSYTRLWQSFLLLQLSCIVYFSDKFPLLFLGIIVNEKCPEVDTITDCFGAEDRKDQDIPQENWKLTYFKRTLSRGEELDMINRSFKELKARPFDFQNIYDDLDPVPLPVLAAEQVAKEVGGKNEAAKRSKDNISDESIYCGDSSFGHAPGIEAITGDAKEKLLNSER